jgi:hypothetical protein
MTRFERYTLRDVVSGEVTGTFASATLCLDTQAARQVDAMQHQQIARRTRCVPEEAHE